MTFLALKIYRYVCPNCLHTFLEKGKHDDHFCWNCGQGLVRIPDDD
jgi:rRNA maturation endonuclease Nob1